MIHNKIWASVQFSKLSNEAKLLYIGMITIADDQGKLNGSPAYLRGQIFPYEDTLSVAQMEKIIQEIKKQKIIHCYKVKGTDYIAHPNWTRYQKLRKDRVKESEIPNDNRLSTRCQPNDGRLPAEEKRREVKVIEDKLKKEIKERKISSLKEFEEFKKQGYRPFFRGEAMRVQSGKLFVLPAEGGDWLEYAGHLEEIEWR